MSIALFHRVKALEARVAELEKKLVIQVSVPSVFLPTDQVKTVTTSTQDRAMCPKCGVKPNYYFHVKNCQGQKNNNGDDGIGTPGTT